jgi:peptide/nickel transport system permease protein
VARRRQIRRLVARRLLIAIPVVVGASILIFAAGRIATPNPSTSALSIFATPETRAQFEEARHLDEPLPVQYGLWIGDAARGDFGTSLVSNQPVSDAVRETLGVTLALALGAFVVSVLVGLALGTAAGLSAGRLLDRLVTGGALLAVAVPAFWLGILLIYFLGVRWRVLPAGGYVPLSVDPVGFFKSMLLPWITLGLAPAAVLARVTRARVAEEVTKPHVRTAISLGISGRRRIQHYVLRNSLVEPTTVLGIQFGYLLGGAVLVEQVFSLPGLGRLALIAANQGDFPIVQVTALLATMAYLLANLAVDVTHLLLESRIHRG